MKKFFYFLTLAFMCLMLGSCEKEIVHKVEMADGRFSDGVLLYDITSKTSKNMEVMVSEYKGEHKNVEIPTAVEFNNEKYRVTSIKGCSFQKDEEDTLMYFIIEVEGAFHECSSLTSITISNSVTTIGECAFYGCSSLTSIKVSDSNPQYDSRDDCNAIIEKSSHSLIVGCKNTIIPNSATSIGNYAFVGLGNLTSITIPNSVTSIGDFAFFGCSGLTSITIPNSVTSIGDKAFHKCSSLTSVTCLCKNPPDVDWSWDFYYTDLTHLHVLPSCKQAYSQIYRWSGFKEIVEDAHE